MSPEKARERVLVIPESHFHQVGFFQGYRTPEPGYLSALLDPTEFSYRPRGEVESDPGFKQLIPYVVLRHQNRLFHYRRGQAGSETRLRSLRSVGLGGHISEEDGDLHGAFQRGMMRELHEEVLLPSLIGEPIPLGLIFDDRTLVGSVHLGIAYLIELAESRVDSREEAIAESGFDRVEQLIQDRDSFETWSQFVFDELTRRARA